MITSRYVLLILASGMLLGGCSIQPRIPDDPTTAWRYDYYQQRPTSILIVPVVNESLDVNAGDLMLSTLPVRVAELGYYVFPTNTVKYVLEQEGFYEADQVHAQPPDALAALFGADAILYVTINQWAAEYAILSANVVVEATYRLVDRNGAELWSQTALKNETDDERTAGQQGGLLERLVAQAIVSAQLRAAPDFMPLARGASSQVFAFEESIFAGRNTLPPGPLALQDEAVKADVDARIAERDSVLAEIEKSNADE